MSFKLTTEGGNGDTRSYRKRQFIPDCRSGERERSLSKGRFNIWHSKKMFISRSERAWKLVWHKEFMKVRRLLKGKCFKSEKSNLESDTLNYRKPV